MTGIACLARLFCLLGRNRWLVNRSVGWTGRRRRRQGKARQCRSGQIRSVGSGRISLLLFFFGWQRFSRGGETRLRKRGTEGEGADKALARRRQRPATSMVTRNARRSGLVKSHGWMLSNTERHSHTHRNVYIYLIYILGNYGLVDYGSLPSSLPLSLHHLDSSGMGCSCLCRGGKHDETFCHRSCQIRTTMFGSVPSNTVYSNRGPRLLLSSVMLL